VTRISIEKNSHRNQVLTRYIYSAYNEQTIDNNHNNNDGMGAKQQYIWGIRDDKQYNQM